MPSMFNDTLLLSHHIDWPETPPKTSVLGKRSDFWRRAARVIWLAAMGYSLVVEIRELIAKSEGRDSRSGALRRLVPRIADAGFLNIETVSIALLYRRFSMSLVSLTPDGWNLAKQFGWQPGENERQRMERLHEKDKNGEAQHTLAVIAFAYHARLRGYQAGVVPMLENSGRFAPDAIVCRENETIYVEVELRGRKFAKWEQMADYQGYVAFCARTEKHRKRLIRENDWELDIPGRATDLQTLFTRAWEDDPGSLWVETW